MQDRTVEALAESIRRTLAAIDVGGLAASTATRYRLQGALVAVEALLHDESTLLPRLLEDDG